MAVGIRSIKRGNLSSNTRSRAPLGWSNLRNKCSLLLSIGWIPLRDLVGATVCKIGGLLLSLIVLY